MTDSPKRPLRALPTAQDVLKAACKRTAVDIQRAADHGVDASDALTVLDGIVVEVQRLLDKERSTDSPPVVSSPLASEITHVLRSNLLARAESMEAAAAVIEVLLALEEVQAREPGGAVGPKDNAQDLRMRLRTPDAFKLLVEVAHDFRSPLTSILFLSETLRDGHSGPLTDHQKSQLGLIYSAAFGLAAIASDVIDLARSEHDLIDPEPEPYAISEVFSGVERLVQPIVQEKGLEFRLRLPERSTASGNPHALGRVLLNLTTNALKHTEEGYVEMGVESRPRNRLEYYVSDTGRGIPEAERDDLFQPFKKSRGQGGAEAFSGSGIGLSIARRLVRAMGSELEFTSSEGEGSRFWFVIPAGG